MQVLRDKLVLDLEPCFRYLDNDKKECIRVSGNTYGYVSISWKQLLWMTLELDDCFRCCWNWLFGFGNECVVFDEWSRLVVRGRNVPRR